MAGRQRHLVEFTDIPCTDNVPAAIGIFFDAGNKLIDLIDRTPIRRAPAAPLRAVNAAEVSIRVGPFIPDGYAVIIEIFYVRVAAQKPEQLVNDRLEVELFGCEQWKAIAQREAGLRAKDGIGTGAGAIR